METEKLREKCVYCHITTFTETGSRHL